MRLALLLIFFTCSSILFGQIRVDLVPQVSDDTPYFNDIITITYSLQISGQGEFRLMNGDIKRPKIPAGFKIVDESLTRGGMQSMLIYTLKLQCNKIGQFEIPPTFAKNGNKKYYSPSFKIRVKKFTQPQGLTPGTNLHFETILSNNSPYKGETIELTYRLYSKDQLSSLRVRKEPIFDSFDIIDSKWYRNQVIKERIINGEKYFVLDVLKYKLVPTESSLFKISPLYLDINTYYKTGRKTRDFFSNRIQDELGERTHRMNSDSVIINVLSLPKPVPQNFTGLVGDFSLGYKLSTRNGKTGEPIKFTVQISGGENIKFWEPQTPKVPNGIAIYPPQKKRDAQTLQYTYLLVPREKGYYRDTLFNFTFFRDGQYYNINTGPLNLNIIQGQTSHSNQNFQDSFAITSVEKEAAGLKKINELNPQNPTYLSDRPIYWILFIFPFLGILPMIILKNHLAERQKNASKIFREKIGAITLRKLEGVSDVNVIGQLLDDYFKAKVQKGFDTDGIHAVIQAFRETGRQMEPLEKLKQLLEEIEILKFAPIKVANTNISAQAIEIIKELEE